MEGEKTVSGNDESLSRAVEEAMAGAGPTLVVVESNDGLANSLVALLPDRLQPVIRGSGALGTRAKVGYVADSMDLADVDGGVLVIENAQWVDPTSLGRVQRLLATGDSDLVVVVAHTPLPPDDTWWLDQLASAAELHGTLVTTRIPSPTGDRVEAPSDEQERDLLLASKLVSGSIPVRVVARFLDISEPDALQLAEGLVQRELLTEARSGFCASQAGLAIEAGAARLGHVAGRLASAFRETGEDEAVVGSLLMAAGEYRQAYPLLRSATLSALAKGAGGEAYRLAESALSAHEAEAAGTSEEIGELHLVCGRFLRDAGRSVDAAEHLEAAVAVLEGPARIDALGFAAAVADDRQHPQETERILAVAAWEAATQGELAKLGSLGTFRARALNRVGFADEADAVMEKAEALLAEHATPTQQFYAEVNRAWISFDRGHVAEAEAQFTHVRDLTDSSDVVGLADKEAWRARALFGSGHPRDALDAVARARDLAAEAEIEAPIFLADLAMAEGSLLYDRPAEALDAAERVWDLVERQLPAWENVARANRALALLKLGRTAEAASEIEGALRATPGGADGWRWRSRCRAIQMEIAAAAGEPFAQREAEDLADLFLQSEYHGWAAELLCVMGEQTKDADTAREAMALAIQVGNPMLAARAASAGDLWSDPAAAPTIRAVKAMEDRIPDDWVEDWKRIVAVAQALAAPEPEEGETGDATARIVQEALERAGLASADTILSPAQRRGQGLVRRRRRRRGPLAMVAAAVGVVVLAVGTSLAVAQFTQSDTPPATVAAADTPAPTTTAPPPPTLEETQIDVPVELLFGTAPYRGDSGRSGYFDVAGPRSVDGYYWVFEAADAITATPLAYGNNLLVGSADGTFQAINLTDGDSSWSMLTEDQIDASGALSLGTSPASSDGTAPIGEDNAAADGTVVVVGDDGVVRARDSLVVTETQIWSTAVGGTIKSSPIVDNGVVYVATTTGVVHALDLGTGDLIWRYPAEGAEPVGRITADLTLANGALYVGTQSGGLHLLRTDGSLVCQATLDAPITVNPVVVDGLAYISYGRVIRMVPVGECPSALLGAGTVQFLSETVVDVAPAVVGDLMYIPNAQFLNAVDRSAVEEGVSSPGEAHHWSEGKVHADGKIVSPPVVTNDAVYFGTETGWVYAVDSDSGDLLWEWQTGNYVRASPVVVEGAVYIASGDGRVYAVGPAG